MKKALYVRWLALLLVLLALAACAGSADAETGMEIIETHAVLVHTSDDKWLECESNGGFHSLVVLDCEEVER